MRFNSNRANRLVFDDVADEYATRPDIPARTFDWCAARSDLGSSRTVLEVGAGAGQLTGLLLEQQARVVAIEPGARLRAVLLERFQTAGLTVVEGLFEDYRSEEEISAIWSANAFHWTDPARAVPHAHELLGPDGVLVLIWTFLIISDADLVGAVKLGRLGGTHVNFGANSREEFLDGFVGAAAEGRDQLTTSGLFGDIEWQHQIEPLDLPAHSYADLVLTFANAAALSEPDRRRLHEVVRDDVEQLDLEHVSFEHHAYALTARATAKR